MEQPKNKIYLRSFRGGYSIMFNSKEVGQFILDEDGDYYFWDRTPNRGGWNQYMLKEISDLLIKVNDKEGNTGA